jgi:hypothetical protein
VPTAIGTAGILEAFGRQAEWCGGAGNAPFTAALMRATQTWLAADAEARAAFDAISSDPLAAAVPLRWAGALHHLALLGREPWATLWPPRGPVQADAGALLAAVRRAWGEQRPHVAAALAHPPQTNEVQRSAALLPGLLHVAAATQRPVALLEIGASAGLNLWCDRWHYAHGAWGKGAAQAHGAWGKGAAQAHGAWGKGAAQAHGAWAWGDPASPLTLSAEWRGAAPAQATAKLEVVQRAGNDAMPVDLAHPGEGLRLASFVWPDQPERLSRLMAAQQAAAAWQRAEGLRLHAQSAADFVARELAAPRPGLARVLMHSVVWQYIAPDEQAAITRSVHAAGAQASAASPLAWLRFEPVGHPLNFELRCQLWPGGRETLLARAHPHGAWVEWLSA